MRMTTTSSITRFRQRKAGQHQGATRKDGANETATSAHSAGDRKTPITYWSARKYGPVAIGKNGWLSSRTNWCKRRHRQRVIHDLYLGLSEVWPETLSHVTHNRRRYPGSESTLQKQRRVGWVNLIYGRWSLGWQEMQSMYFQYIGARNSVKRWQSQVIRLLWNTAWDFWNFRNKVLHEQDNCTINDIRQSTINQIRYQWNLGIEGLEALDRVFFPSTINSLLQQSLGYQQTWLRRIQQARNYG